MDASFSLLAVRQPGSQPGSIDLTTHDLYNTIVWTPPFRLTSLWRRVRRPPVTTILLSRTARTTQQQQQQQFRDNGMTGRLDTLPLVHAGPSPRQGTSSPSAKRLGLSRIAESFVRGTTLPPPSRPTSSQHSRYQNNMNDKQLTSHMPTSTLSDLGNTIEPANPTQGTPPWTAVIDPCTRSYGVTR
jgi:hypothetical protein